MKRCWFGGGLLVFLLISGLVLSKHMDAFHQDLSEQMTQSAALAGEDRTSAQKLADQTQKSWERRRWLTAVLLEKGCGVSPADLIEGMNRVNAESRHLWKPLHRQPVFAQVPYVTAGADSVSDDLFSRGVCLPSDTKMTEADLESLTALCSYDYSRTIGSFKVLDADAIRAIYEGANL